MKNIEPLVWAAVFLATAGWVGAEGQRRQSLETQVPISAKELYQKLARSQVKLQVIDIRPELEDNYEDAHIPGAIPLPGCDLSAAPPAAAAQILTSAPTIVVSADGDAGTFQGCSGQFKQARNLAGGMEAWTDAAYPEDTGEYMPPKAGAGGGCL